MEGVGENENISTDGQVMTEYSELPGWNGRFTVSAKRRMVL